MHRRWRPRAALAGGTLLIGAALVTAATVTPAAAAPAPSAVVDRAGAQLDRFLDAVGLDDLGPEAAPGTLDDGQDLLPLATISLDDAITAARSAAAGDLGEVDLEYFNGTLVYNIDIGPSDVKVDAATGAVLATNLDD